jgi:hypothetical protein
VSRLLPEAFDAFATYEKRVLGLASPTRPLEEAAS